MKKILCSAATSTPLAKKLLVVKGRGRGKLRDFTEGFLPRGNEMEKENKEK